MPLPATPVIAQMGRILRRLCPCAVHRLGDTACVGRASGTREATGGALAQPSAAPPWASAARRCRPDRRRVAGRRDHLRDRRAPDRRSDLPDRMARDVVGAGDRDDRRVRRRRSAGPVGRVIASFLLLGGLALISVLTATITSGFVARAQRETPSSSKSNSWLEIRRAAGTGRGTRRGPRAVTGRAGALSLRSRQGRGGPREAPAREEPDRELPQRLAAERDDADRDQRAEQQDAPPGAQRVSAAPEDQQQERGADARPGDARPLVEHRRDPAGGRRRPPSSARRGWRRRPR